MCGWNRVRSNHIVGSSDIISWPVCKILLQWWRLPIQVKRTKTRVDEFDRTWFHHWRRLRTVPILEFPFLVPPQLVEPIIHFNQNVGSSSDKVQPSQLQIPTHRVFPRRTLFSIPVDSQMPLYCSNFHPSESSRRSGIVWWGTDQLRLSS